MTNFHWSICQYGTTDLHSIRSAVCRNTYQQSLKSQEIMNRPVFVLEILKKSDHSEHWLKILNRFWTFWTFSEKSEQILNIVWKVWTESEYFEHCLNREFKLNYNNYITAFLIKFDIFFISIFLLKSIYVTSFSLDFIKI